LCVFFALFAFFAVDLYSPFLHEAEWASS
jgi:hypothetical protein